MRKKGAGERENTLTAKRGGRRCDEKGNIIALGLPVDFDSDGFASGHFGDQKTEVIEDIEVKTNKNSAFGTKARPFTPEEMSILEKYVDRGYKLFRQRVAEGRKMTTDQVEQIAQGHVWIGQDAMKIKLVDELGGIEKAINKAAALAKIKDFHTQSYPAQTDWITQLMDRMEGSNYLDEQMRVTLGEYYDVFSTMKTMNQQSAIQARIPYYIYVR